MMKGKQLELLTEQETTQPTVEVMALSVKQPFASQIAAGEKAIEYRSWGTAHRGDLLIVATKQPHIDGLPSGEAVGIVNLTACERAGDGTWRWLLSDARPVEPFSVKGQLGLYKVTVPAKPQFN